MTDACSVGTTFAGRPPGMSGARRAAALLLLLAAFAPRPSALEAQQRDSIPGVQLGLVYENVYQPRMAVKPFTGRFGGGSLAGQVEAIVARDLHFSDRFVIMDSIPPALVGDGLDYGLWDRLGADFLVTGQVEGVGEDWVLLLEVHDVVYSQVKERGRFPLPAADHPDFRMAVHRASDQVVRWVSGEPGMAASRIVFTVRTPSGSKELYLIDSDGENMRRITSFGDLTLSPAWSYDGRRLAYSSYKAGTPRIYEMDLATGRERLVEAVREGDHITPSYHPNGQLGFAVTGGGRSGIFLYDVERGCCLAHLTGAPRADDLSPVFSPDGRWMAFNSNRLGTHVPQIYLMPAGGGEAELLSPYQYGREGWYTSPDWSPYGGLVAFHGRVGRTGRYHILVARIEERGRVIRQLTWEGNNEDPSWAPDGRHLVFAGERQWGRGLFVVDSGSGRIRPLVTGVEVGLPDWSPSLAPESGARR